jgi:predicted thioesterase
LVDAGNTARAVGSGSLEVFATPMLVALLEEAACRCLAGRLAPGQTSVGAELTLAHEAPSPLGAQVTAQAEIEWARGRAVGFLLRAWDGAGPIASGRHRRVLVDGERFLQNAAGRQAGALGEHHG